MPMVGEQLRAAREARKLGIQEVAEATNMRTDHIRALEEGNYAPFPAPVYIRGSVRTYAKLLKLDVMAIMEALAVELNQGGPQGATPDGVPHRRGVVESLALQMARFGLRRSLILLTVLALVAVVLLIRALRSDVPQPDPLADLPPPTYQPADSSSGGYLPLPGTNQ
jgi:cytoskeleton protein RodZ